MRKIKVSPFWSKVGIVAAIFAGFSFMGDVIQPGGGGSSSGITALTGDISASGPGSATATLPNVNTNVGSFTNATVTANAKGQVTAVASGTAPPTAANPSASVSGNAVNGSASTFMRSDAAPPLANTAVTPGSYTCTNLTVDAQGRSTAASNGSCISGIGPGFISGNFYYRRNNVAFVTQVLSANTLYATPVYIGSAGTFTQFNVGINTGSAGNFADLGIYANNGNGAPGSLVQDVGQISVASTGVITKTGSVTISTPGWYWMVVWNGAGTPSLTANATTDSALQPYFGQNSSNQVLQGYTGTAAYSTGNMPGTFPSPSAIFNASIPIAGFRL